MKLYEFLLSEAASGAESVDGPGGVLHVYKNYWFQISIVCVCVFSPLPNRKTAAQVAQQKRQPVVDLARAR
jgi:hypothetical protein